MDNRNILERILRKTWLIGALIALLISASAVYAGSVESEQEKGVLRATLKNGLRVVIVRNTLSPVVSTMVNYLVGSDEAPEGFPGMAHAQEHMMFRGSPGLSANQLADIIAVMGGMFDADTQQAVTQYFLTVPAKDLDVALHIESIRMRGVLDSERLWDRERGAIKQEVAQDLSDPEYVFYTRLIADMFRGTPYAYTPLGTVSSFNKTTGVMLKKFYETWYAPNNAIMVIVGNVDPRKALRRVKKYFGDILPKKMPPRPEIHLEPVKPETLQLKTDKSYGMALISFRMPGYDNEDYAASRVLADIVSSQRSNLFSLVPEGKALYAGFSLSTLPKAGLGYAVAAFPKGADTSALISEVRQILSGYLEKGFPAEFVEAAKKNTLTKAELKKNSILGLAMTWSQALTMEGRRSPEDNLKAIGQVSATDVNRVARKYLDLDQAVIAVLDPESSGKAVSSKPHGGMESFAPKHAKAVKLPHWAEKALKRLSVPVSTVKPDVTVFPNGLKLIVQPESVSDTISVYGHITNNADLETPEGKEGVDDLLSGLLSFGTTSLDRLAFQKALDDIGARESAGTDFALEVLAGDFDRGVELLADNELRPALPEAAFEVLRKQAADTAAGLLKSPAHLTKQAMKEALFPKHDPSLRQATPATILSLTLKDVKEYYQKVFRPDMTTIVVIGKVTNKEAKSLIKKYFGSWKAAGRKPATLLPPVPPNKPSVASVPDASRIQDKVILAETLGLTRSNPDYYALQLGNHVLGGAFYATRLYRDLREETGLVYYVSSSFDVGRKRSLYAVEYGCDPDNVLKARAIVERNLRMMRTVPVTDKELDQAKALLLRDIPLSESSVDRIAGGLIYRAAHDLPLDEPTIAAHRYLRLSAAKVKKAFGKWLRPGDLVQVTEGPIPR
jgi:zinc protease